MEKKFQIFISSTFEDLKNEREAVAKAILEIGDIPVGMEMFSAADEDQWRLIQRQIEQSDYYVVLLAHRYGSEIDGLSYTEKEYDYAVSKGVPVLGFVIEPRAEWPANLMDSGSPKAKLDAFKIKIKSRMVSFWSNSDVLNSKILAAISKQKNLNPRPGWVRAINIPSTEVLTQLADASREVARLSEENAKLRETAGIDSKFALIDAMADDRSCQAAIFMYQNDVDLPKYGNYVFGYKYGGGGSGPLGGFGKDGLEAAGVFRLGGNGHILRLTDEGRRFAEWLLLKGRKCDFFWTEKGGWGVPEPGSAQEKWMRDLGFKIPEAVDESDLVV